jgi:hypothetical protein
MLVLGYVSIYVIVMVYMIVYMIIYIWIVLLLWYPYDSYMINDIYRYG